MSPTVLPAPKPEQGLAGRHVLWAMIVFFATIFAVNGVLLYKALSTHSGLVAQEPYRKGLQYNERVAADERQRALGWTEAVDLETTGALSVKLTNSLGGPVTDLALRGFVGRPSTTRHDIAVTLKETAPGVYSAAVGALETGAWMLSVEARPTVGGREAADADPIYRLKRRLWLKP